MIFPSFNFNYYLPIIVGLVAWQDLLNVVACLVVVDMIAYASESYPVLMIKYTAKF